MTTIALPVLCTGELKIFHSTLKIAISAKIGPYTLGPRDITNYLICCVMYLSRNERKDSMSSADKSVHSLITLSRTVVAA